MVRGDKRLAVKSYMYDPDWRPGWEIDGREPAWTSGDVSTNPGGGSKRSVGNRAGH